MVNESIVCCLCSTFCRCIPLMGLFIDSKCISFIDFFNLRKLRKTFFKTDQVLMGKKKIRFSKIDAALFRCSSMDIDFSCLKNSSFKRRNMMFATCHFLSIYTFEFYPVLRFGFHNLCWTQFFCR